jgi:hypothetical protein
MLGVSLKFHPNQANPARQSGRGVYRVHECRDWWTPIYRPTVIDAAAGRLLVMRADRPYKKGSRVDPKKIALAVLRG